MTAILILKGSNKKQKETVQISNSQFVLAIFDRNKSAMVRIPRFRCKLVSQVPLKSSLNWLLAAWIRPL